MTKVSHRILVLSVVCQLLILLVIPGNVSIAQQEDSSRPRRRIVTQPAKNMQDNQPSEPDDDNLPLSRDNNQSSRDNSQPSRNNEEPSRDNQRPSRDDNRSSRDNGEPTNNTTGNTTSNNRDKDRDRSSTIPQSDNATQESNASQQANQEVGDEGTLKIGVELVQVVFSVVDDKNRLVTDLKPSEIELYDNGQPQQIELFQHSNNLPMMLSVLIDVSGSQAFLLPEEKTAVETFFDSFMKEGKDYGALLTFHGETYLNAGLTSNLSRLKRSLQKIKKEEIFRDDEAGVPNLGTALYDAIDITAREVMDGNTARRITASDSGGGGRRTAIRRAICLLTDGADTASDLTLDQAIRSAQRGGVAIYALGMGDRFRFGNVDQQVLDSLCKETGGRAFYPKSESALRQAFQQIADELSSQYILAYYPNGASDDPKNFRPLEIKIPRESQWRVIHRRGYQLDKH